eukprot:2120729-Rhodomonas_salina.1
MCRRAVAACLAPRLRAVSPSASVRWPVRGGGLNWGGALETGRESPDPKMILERDGKCELRVGDVRGVGQGLCGGGGGGMAAEMLMSLGVVGPAGWGRNVFCDEEVVKSEWGRC